MDYSDTKNELRFMYIGINIVYCDGMKNNLGKFPLDVLLLLQYKAERMPQSPCHQTYVNYISW